MVRGRAVPQLSRVLSLLAATVVLGVALPARADVSSWIGVQAGPTWIDEGKGAYTVPSLKLTTGIGTAPGDLLAAGGLFHVEPQFGKGVDLGLLARLATRGYVLGDFGLALDLGGYERFWGVRSAGGLGALTFGAPWGLILSVDGGIGTNDAHHFGVTFGVDFARLTIYRTTGKNWMPNPKPVFER